MKRTTESTARQGKDAIIQLANSILKDKYPALHMNLDEFEISAWSNSKKVLVKYRRRIRYIPQGRKEDDFDYDISVDVISKEVYPFDWRRTGNFYIPSDEDARNIEFVKNAFGLPHQGFENRVFEEDTIFVIELDNEMTYGKHYIDKVTGKEVLPALEGSYMSDPNNFNEDTIDEEPLTEITN